MLGWVYKDLVLITHLVHIITPPKKTQIMLDRNITECFSIKLLNNKITYVNWRITWKECC